jgi:hypothetical protein
VLAIEAENLPAPTKNPAGLIVTLLAQNQIGEVYTFRSDDTWRCVAEVEVSEASLDWTTLDFDDKDWKPAKEVAAYKSPPWGEFSEAIGYGPYATGIPGKIRIIYVAAAQAVRVLHLEKDAKYQTYVFDPTSGKMIKTGIAAADDQGEWSSPDEHRVNSDEDWVLIMERVD